MGKLDKIVVENGEVKIPIDIIESWSDSLSNFEFDTNRTTPLSDVLDNIINEHYSNLPIDNKVEEKVEEDELEPYCSDCGSTDLRYLDQYANGDEYRCKTCKKKFMWIK